MTMEMQRPGGDARPGELSTFGGVGSQNTPNRPAQQELQMRRRQERHGIPADLTALVAGLVYGEVAA